MVFAVPVLVHADTVERSTVVFTLPRLAQLQISGDLSGLLALSADATGEAAYDLGHVVSAPDATVLTITSTDSWALSARLAGEWTCPGTYDKDEADLRVAITNTPVGTIENGAAGFIPLSGVDTVILSDGSGVAGNEVDIQTRVLLDWEEDVPGAYSIAVTYTLIGYVP